jgi:phosphonate ABC transporter substrate-binding protein
MDWLARSSWACRAGLFALGLLWGVSSTRGADLVVYVPDGPQDPSSTVAAFGPLEADAKKTGLALSGRYFVQLADFQKFVDSGHPGFGVVDAVYFLEERQKLDLQPLATAQDAAGASTQQYCLAVATSKPWQRIDELSGKSLAQTPLAGKYPVFVSEFLLEGVLPSTFFQTKPVPHAASAMRAVELGESDGAFVPCAQVGKDKKLRTVFTSRPIPMALLVAFGGAAAADVEKARTVFGGLGPASPLCKALGVGRFGAVPADYDKTLQAYRSNPVPTLEDLRVSKVQGQTGNVVPSGLLTGSFVGKMRTRFMPSGQP